MDSEFLLFLLVGFLAQCVDGALGMAYGVTASTVLLSAGVPPAQASAIVHFAELFTTGISGGSHLLFRNIDRRLFLRLAPAGVLGGVLGTYLLTSIDGATLRPFVAAYLGLMGLFILARALRFPRPRQIGAHALFPIGTMGGFMDAVGGGGWGPIVTSTLIGVGEQPRYVIGSVNAAEFFVTAAISGAFVTALLTGHWTEGGDVRSHGMAVLGLILGGAAAAPFAGYLVKIAPIRLLGGAAGLLVLGLSIRQIWLLLG